MIRVWIAMAIVWVAIVAALFTLADVIARAVGRPDDIHLCAIAIIVAVMLFSGWLVSAVDRAAEILSNNPRRRFPANRKASL